MNIENEIFKRARVLFDKLEKYGFKKYDDSYVYEKIFLNNEFKAIISINDKGNITGKIIDLEFNEEYTNIRTDMSGEFVSKVREEYKSILYDILDKCCISNYFIFDQTNRVNNYIKKKYNSEPEFLWEKTPGCGVYRNKKNNKWYGIIMNIDMSKIDNGSGEVEIMNIKLDRREIQGLLNEKGFYKAYHMNKQDWITIVLNDTLKDEIIFLLIDESYNIINSQ